MMALASFVRPKLFLSVLLGIQAFALAGPHQGQAKDFSIVDFRPSIFVEQPVAPFFYSIGGKIRFGSTLTDSGPVLFDTKGGELAGVFVSPDQSKAAIVSKGALYIADTNKPAMAVLKDIDNYVGTAHSVGETFYKYPTIQWDDQSHFIYIVRDKKQAQVFKQGGTTDSMLVRLDVGKPADPLEVVRDFRSTRYFLVGQNTVCFDDAIGNGNLAWKCSTEGRSKLAKTIVSGAVLLEDGNSISGEPFISYNPNIYESEIWLTHNGFSLLTTPTGHTGLFSKQRPDKAIFVVKGRYNNKGHYFDGILQQNCIVLPGGRYALLDIWLGNFQGQLLVDGITGQYHELPHNTRAYRNLNSSNYPNVIVGLRPLDFPEFTPTSALRRSVQTFPGGKP